jgi:hypothetical protein
LIEGALLMALVLMAGVPVQAATDLTLASNLSFVDDSSPNFPIEANTSTTPPSPVTARL